LLLPCALDAFVAFADPRAQPTKIGRIPRAPGPDAAVRRVVLRAAGTALGTEIDSLLASAGILGHEVPQLRVLEICGLPREFGERGGLAGMAETAMAFR